MKISSWENKSAGGLKTQEVLMHSNSYDTILAAYINGTQNAVASIADIHTAWSLKSGYGSFVPILKRWIASDFDMFFKVSAHMAQDGLSENEIREYMENSCIRTAKAAITEYQAVIA